MASSKVQIGHQSGIKYNKKCIIFCPKLPNRYKMVAIKLIFLMALLCSCGKGSQSSSFSRLRNYKLHELTKTVSVGYAHACAILISDGILKCWGENAYGQLGTGDNKSPQKIPVTIDLGIDRNAKAISVGSNHSCVILDDDSLKCWGYNQYGEIGDASTTQRNLPTLVDLGENRTAKAISAGNGHTCAILNDDSIKCWGDNQYGQIGIKTNLPYQTTPTGVSLGADKTAKMISLGDYHSCAILNDDSLKCWGYNQYGQVGDDSTSNRNFPTLIDLGENRTARTVDAGGDHTCTLLDNHTLHCWGFNDSGQLGDGTTTTRTSPAAVNLRSLYPPEALSLGHRHSCILLTNGIPHCWGKNNHRQLGDGSLKPNSIPVIPNLGTGTTARVVSAGSRHTCAIIEDDSLVCWGCWNEGNTADCHLGDGSTKPKSIPVTVKL